MSEQDSIEETGNIKLDKDTHPLIKLGILSVGTKVGAEIILKLAKHPLLLLAMGVGAGIYMNKNRKEIIEAAQQLKDQGLDIVKKID